MSKVLGLRGLQLAGLVALLLGSGCGEEDAAGAVNGVKEGGGQFTPPPFGFSATTTAIVTPEIIIAPQDPDAAVMDVNCGDGVLGGDEVCDPAIHPCCNATCDGVRESGEVCNESTGACDAAEVCDGDSFRCPEDVLAEAGAECRPSAGGCDVAETCDGASTVCPPDAVAEVDTECRPSAGDCDVAELCDGTSVECPANVLADAETVCRDAEGFCDIAELCTGESAQCPEDLVEGMDEAAPFLCRQANMGSCDAPEYCDGENKECPEDLYLEAGTTCQTSLGTCDRGEICDGESPDCPPATNTPAPRGTPCRPAAPGGCDVAEVCDGSAITCPPDGFARSSVICRDDSGLGCDVAERCTGTSAACPPNGFEEEDTACHPSTGVCDPVEVCSGTSDVCPANQFFDDTDPPCRASTGVCDPAEMCNGTSGTCPANDFLGPTDAPCRASTGVCDPAEVCTGTSGMCPANTFLTSVCRASTGVCDPAESCTGTSGACPANDFLGPTDPPCRASAGVCDPAEVCTGSSGACPANDFLGPTDAPCRASAGACDIAEVCPGNSAQCPANDFLDPDDAPCRASAGACDIAEVCPGNSALCPANDFLDPTDAPCRASAGACDIAEVCPGNSALCPANDFLDPTDAPCRPSAGICDVAEVCPGDSAACPTNAFAVGTVCRASADLCDAAETCGAAAACPANARIPEGGACNTGLGTCSMDVCCPGVTTNNGRDECDIDRNNLVFVSSSTSNGSFGGLAGADDECQKLAEDANLAGTYRAWLSAPGSGRLPIPATSRVTGQGPFMLVTGAVVADNVDDMIDDDGPARPINITQWNQTTRTTQVWTGTTGGGAYSDNSCGAWNATTANGTVGDPTDHTSAWTANANASCDSAAALYCFQQGCFGSLQDDENNCGTCGNRCAPTETCIAGTCGAYAFVTSTGQNGDFNGVAGGDATCNSLARAAGRSGTFVAWLSASNNPAGARVLDTAYYRFDNRRIAANRDALLSASRETPLENPINVRENGVTIPAAEVLPVWTGTSPSGTFVSPNCSGWNVPNDGNGIAGNPTATDDTWTNVTANGYPCIVSLPIYCFQVTR